MSKLTYIEDLHQSYLKELQARRYRCFSPYKSRGNYRWLEVCNAHNRKATRKARRCIGKSNKIGGRKTGKGMCGFLLELKMWSGFTSRNRESLGLPKRVYRISHSGVISCDQ
ncbi:hypothetical protein ACTVKF_18515 [Serratia marcescens]|uniref:hypothetical protein n=1 Tax=Serratia TaxID=613 RepID=UPI000C13271A|nr:hypothetical protein [Serratia marcescens]MDX6807921.1 hypothetical protein [Serratia marcescens]PHY87885.1 hypothetical protein CS370_06375 [Serratia marcescens]HBC7448614.1 hypothetical protein [Serratia marcescens]